MNDTTGWYDIKKVAENSYRISECGHYHMYLLLGKNEALLIDTGVGVGDLHEVVHNLVETPVRVLLTHSHWDHIGNAHQFDRVMISEHERTSDGCVTVDQLGNIFEERIPEALEERREEGVEYPDGFRSEDHTIPPATAVTAVNPGERFDLGGRELRLVGIPGHSPGQLGVLDCDNSEFYGADIMGSNGKLLAHFPGSDLEEYFETFEHLIRRYQDNEFNILLTGHNDPVEEDGLTVLNDLYNGISKILDGEQSFELANLTTGQARKYNVNGYRIFTSY